MLEPVLKNVAVILPAAGSAERFVTSITSRGSPSNGLRRPEDLKQFLPVGPDKVPLFIHTIDAFARYVPCIKIVPWLMLHLLGFPGLARWFLLFRSNMLAQSRMLLLSIWLLKWPRRYLWLTAALLDTEQYRMDWQNWRVWLYFRKWFWFTTLFGPLSRRQFAGA